MINTNLSDNIHNYIVSCQDSGDIAFDIALDILLRYGVELTKKELTTFIDEHTLIDYSDDEEKKFQLDAVSEQYYAFIYETHTGWYIPKKI